MCNQFDQFIRSNFLSNIIWWHDRAGVCIPVFVLYKFELSVKNFISSEFKISPQCYINDKMSMLFIQKCIPVIVNPNNTENASVMST